MRQVGVGCRQTSTARPVGPGGRGPSARGGDAIVQLTRLSEESFELLHGRGRVRNVRAPLRK